MPLPVDFWTASWADKLCIPDFSGGVVVYNTSGGSVDVDFTQPVNMVYSEVGSFFPEDTTLQNDRSAGLIYGKEVGTDETLPFDDASCQGQLPHSPLAPLETVFSTRGGWYRPPFLGMQIIFGGPTDDGSAGSGALASRVLAHTPTDDIASYELWHWQPLTIVGTIAEVIGALLMYLGADPDTDIDQDSFDDAYDEMISYGDDPVDQPFVWFRAVEGEAVGDSIRRIIDHYFSFLVVDLRGKIAIKSRISGTPSTEPITPASVVGDPVISLPLDRITNTADYSYGEWSCKRKGGVAGYDKEFSGDPGRSYFRIVENTVSIELFGKRSWNKQTRRDIVKGKEVNVPAASFPYYYYSQQSNLMISKLDSVDANRVSLLTIKQGMIGLDYGAGEEVESVDVNSNAEVGGYFWCITQTVDFNSMTVVNVIQDEARLILP